MFILNTAAFDTTPVVAFTGVNEGYQGELTPVTDEAKAAEAVTAAVKAAGIDGARVFPGRVVYHADWGCPVGGEVVGAVFAEGDHATLVSRFEAVRTALKQTTLSVATEPGIGEATTGFIADLGEGDLSTVATRWQEVAAECFGVTGTYVSGGVFEIGGRVFAMAEGNPAFVTDIEAWKGIVSEVVGAVDSGAKPVFRAVGFNYLKEAEAA